MEPTTNSLPMDEGEIVDTLEITEPLNGATVEPGTALSVNVSGTDGFVPTRVLIVAPHDGGIIESPPFTMALDIPAEALGPFNIAAYGLDADGNVAVAAEITVNAQTSATLIELSVAPGTLFLLDIEPIDRIHVSGLFSDGVERDVSSAAHGTTYFSFDATTAAIDAQGNVTAVAAGTTTVVAQNGAFSANATVNVVSIPCPSDATGDTDSDGDFDLFDFASFQGCFGETTTECTDSFDFDGNGSIDAEDLHCLRFKLAPM